jgi:hypothetical protein
MTSAFDFFVGNSRSCLLSDLLCTLKEAALHDRITESVHVLVREDRIVCWVLVLGLLTSRKECTESVAICKTSRDQSVFNDRGVLFIESVTLVDPFHPVKAVKVRRKTMSSPLNELVHNVRGKDFCELPIDHLADRFEELIAYSFLGRDVIHRTLKLVKSLVKLGRRCQSDLKTDVERLESFKIVIVRLLHVTACFGSNEHLLKLEGRVPVKLAKCLPCERVDYLIESRVDLGRSDLTHNLADGVQVVRHDIDWRPHVVLW